VFAGFEQKTTDSATLLRAPISTGSAMTDCLAARRADLARAVERRKSASDHALNDLSTRAFASAGIQATK